MESAIPVDRKMFVHRRGDKGLPLVLLHGTASMGQHWLPVVRWLPMEFAIFSPDLIGFGRTPRWPEPRALRLDHQVRILNAGFEAGQNVPVHIVGHCYGGALALRWAQLFPANVRSLTLVEPMVNQLLKEHGEEVLFSVFEEPYRYFVENAIDRDCDYCWRSIIEIRGGLGAWDRFSKEKKNRLIKRTPAVVDTLLSSLLNPMKSDDIRAIEVPTILIHSERATNPEKKMCNILETLIKNVALKEIKNSGHSLCITHSRIVSDIIAQHAKKYN